MLLLINIKVTVSQQLMTDSRRAGRTEIGANTSRIIKFLSDLIQLFVDVSFRAKEAPLRILCPISIHSQGIKVKWSRAVFRAIQRSLMLWEWQEAPEDDGDDDDGIVSYRIG